MLKKILFFFCNLIVLSIASSEESLQINEQAKQTYARLLKQVSSEDLQGSSFVSMSTDIPHILDEQSDEPTELERIAAAVGFITRDVFGIESPRADYFKRTGSFRNPDELPEPHFQICKPEKFTPFFGHRPDEEYHGLLAVEDEPLQIFPELVVEMEQNESRSKEVLQKIRELNAHIQHAVRTQKKRDEAVEALKEVGRIGTMAQEKQKAYRKPQDSDI